MSTGPKRYGSVDEIKRHNAQRGRHWFKPDTMRFFKSRIGDTVLRGRYFVTSEKPPHGRRAYAARLCIDGGIESLGSVCDFGTSRQAQAFIRDLPEMLPEALADAMAAFNVEGSEEETLAAWGHQLQENTEYGEAARYLVENRESLGFWFLTMWAKMLPEAVSDV